MKWKDVKFWCWIEVDFPSQQSPGPQGPEENLDFLEEIDPTVDEIPTWKEYAEEQGIVPQGSQSQQTCYSVPAGKKVCFDLLSVSTEFELNSIPTAVVSVALGRRADDVNIVSDIHYWVDQLKLQLPVRVWCIARSVDSSEGSTGVSKQWPNGKFKIFDGYITGSAFRRTGLGAEMTLSLTHWLVDMNFSSAVSKQSHPLNPAQFYFGANIIFGREGSGGGTTTPPEMTATQVALPFFNVDTVFEDFWGGVSSKTGLKNWLLELTRNDRINRDQIRSVFAGDIEATQNWEACRALQRFEPNAHTPEVTETGYKLGVKLGMKNFRGLNSNIANSIAMNIGKESLEAYHNVTLWDKLAGQLHANYMYSVVPLVDKALVVPYVPGLSSGDDRKLVHRILQTSDYDSIDLQSALIRPLRAVGILMTRRFQAGGSTNVKDESAQYVSFGGWFDKKKPENDKDLIPLGAAPKPDPRYAEGLIMITRGPNWLAGLVDYSKWTNESTGNSNKGIGTSNALDGGKTPEGKTPRQILEEGRPVWNLYARTVYMHEALKHRQGTITGPVRFDIAPGSTLKVEVAEDKFVKQIVFKDVPKGAECEDKYFKFFWCQVLHVSTMIDCQNMRAFTNFYVAYIRDRNENKDVGTAIARHPLWQKYRWAGCVLVQDKAFEPLATKD